MYDLTYNNIFIGGMNNNVICGGDYTGNTVSLGVYSSQEKAKEVFDELINACHNGIALNGGAKEIQEMMNYYSPVGSQPSMITIKMPIEEEGEDE